MPLIGGQPSLLGQRDKDHSIAVVLPEDQTPIPVTVEGFEIGDIAIGAVEIKDGDSDTRVDVEADPEATTKNSMFVQAPSLLDVLEQILAAQGGGNPVEKFGETSVSGNTETTLASYTVPAGKKVQVRGIFGEGVDNGVFRLYIDGTKVWQKRNAWTDRNVEGAMFAEATASQAIEVKVLNLMPVAMDFSGGFFGIEL